MRWMCSVISLLPPPLAPSCIRISWFSYGVTTATAAQWLVVQPSRSPLSSSIEYTPFFALGPG